MALHRWLPLTLTTVPRVHTREGRLAQKGLAAALCIRSKISNTHPMLSGCTEACASRSQPGPSSPGEGARGSRLSVHVHATDGNTGRSALGPNTPGAPGFLSKQDLPDVSWKHKYGAGLG